MAIGTQTETLELHKVGVNQQEPVDPRDRNGEIIHGLLERFRFIQTDSFQSISPEQFAVERIQADGNQHIYIVHQKKNPGSVHYGIQKNSIRDEEEVVIYTDKTPGGRSERMTVPIPVKSRHSIGVNIYYGSSTDPICGDTVCYSLKGNLVPVTDILPHYTVIFPDAIGSYPSEKGTENGIRVVDVVE